MLIFETLNALLLILLIWRQVQMSDSMDRLQQSINDMSVVEDAAIALIADLANRIRANMNDPVALDNMAKQLDEKRDALAAAIAANTVATPPTDPAA
jgi:ABC-type transporter Mla MlaB component